MGLFFDDPRFIENEALVHPLSGLGLWFRVLASSGVLKSRVLVSGFRGCDFKRDGSSAQTERKPQLLNRIRVSVSRGPTTPKRVSQALAQTVGSKRITRKIKTFITHLSLTHSKTSLPQPNHESSKTAASQKTINNKILTNIMDVLNLNSNITENHKRNTLTNIMDF